MYRATVRPLHVVNAIHPATGIGEDPNGESDSGMVDDPDGADAPMVGDHLIVMGTDGGTGLRRQLLGNVAERVLRRVAVSLMTVRKEDANLLEFDETAGRRRTGAGRRGVPLLVSSRSAPESAFLPAGLDHEILNS
jgi:hypothetical protein